MLILELVTGLEKCGCKQASETLPIQLQQKVVQPPACEHLVLVLRIFFPESITSDQNPGQEATDCKRQGELSKVTGRISTIDPEISCTEYSEHVLGTYAPASKHSMCGVFMKAHDPRFCQEKKT